MSTVTLSHGTVSHPSARRVPVKVLPERTVRAAAERPVPTAALRLTRRGRLAVFCGSLLVIMVLGLFVGATSVATREVGVGSATEVVVVGSGESLWSIAHDVAGSRDRDVREVMFEIERLNALESEFLYAGQRLRVPAS